MKSKCCSVVSILCFLCCSSFSPPMMEVENFTIFIKNSIRFPTFNYTKYGNGLILRFVMMVCTHSDVWYVDIMICLYVCRGNFLPSITDSYIKNCHFDMTNNTYCPIFKVGDVVRYAQQNFTKLANKVNKQRKYIFTVFE